MTLTEYRKEYTLAGLRRRDLAEDPLVQFEKWFGQAVSAGVAEPTALTLGTSDATGRLSVRTVLLKAVDARGFVFCTSYDSRKGNDLGVNANAALCFLWRELERQVCIAGTVTKTSREESEMYFAARPRGSQLGAWASRQSAAVSSREILEQQFAAAEEKFAGQKIPCPENWGGYLVKPTSIQFWQGGVNRLHDRFNYKRRDDGHWVIERLSP